MQIPGRIKRTYKLGSIFILAGAILLIFVILLQSPKRKEAVDSGLPDFKNHPVYSTYHFPKDENVICIGIQPLWVFGGNITEIMKRDAILYQNLQKLGLKILFYPFLKGADVNFFVRNGDLDGGMCGDMPTLRIASTLDVVVPSLIDRGFDYIVANRYMLIKDLKGKRIGYPFGASAHHALLEAITSAGLSEEQVTLIPMDVTEMPEALQKRELDALAAWEPIVSQALMEVPGSTVIYRRHWLTFTYFRRDFADKHPEAMHQILAAEIRAIRWMLRSRQNLLQSSQWTIKAGEELSGERFGISAEQFVDIIIRDGMINIIPIISKADLQENGHLHREFRFLKALNKIPAASDWESVRKMFDRQIIKNILANPQKYPLDEFNYEIGGSDE